MAITPTPDQQRLIQEGLQAGLIESAEEVLDVGLKSLRDRLMKQMTGPAAGRKTLVELFEPLRGLELEFSRNSSTGRPIEV
jgi:hypothetical protein